MSKRYKYEVARMRKTIAGVSADDVVCELSRIHEDNGVLTAKAVVDESRPEDAVLHPVFEWDDHVAGEKWREHEARELIRSVVVVSDDESERAPVFINTVRVVDGGVVRSYEPAQTVVRDKQMLESSLALLRHQVGGLLDTIRSIERMATDDARKVRITAMASHAQALSAELAAV